MEESIGQYKCLKVIGRGGMGEVLLCYDPICDRQVAVKRIRPDLKQHPALRNRFLREAKITAGLTHPGIVSIYSIHAEGELLYYSMPYIECKTFKQTINEAQTAPTALTSIPALLPIFKNICQTVSYAHSKGFLHRDLKPENILVGTFGEVIILDWGLAHPILEPPQEGDEFVIAETDPDLTKPGKLVGTVAFMAPERALGKPASIQTDIYALGVILFQILTLQFPFSRSSIKEFRKSYKYEKLLDPEELAPYRDVPPRLARMVTKCLDPDPSQRYSSTEQLLLDLAAHMEGRSEWFESTRLKIDRKEDWEFQENVLISKHIAITRFTETAEWVSMMVSKHSFAENTRLQTRVKIDKDGMGIGFLLSIPEAAQRGNPLEGYCLWLGSEESPGLELIRNTIQVMQLPELFLKKGVWHELVIEKIGNKIQFSMDGTHYLNYLSYLPLFGSHVGLVSRDNNFQIDDLLISIASQPLSVSCLSIPDAFLAAKDYQRALAEYRRIGYSFPGHAEGREALFRAGITLLEQAKTTRKAKESKEYYQLALDEFAKLHTTPGAPLEYLGKALVYQSLREYSEEIKCLEFGLRRYFHHPLVHALIEQILYRLHESTQNNRKAAYQLILITLRLLPHIVESSDFHRLMKHLAKNWEPLPFLESPTDPSQLGQEKRQQLLVSTSLAFWLGMPYTLQDLFHQFQKDSERVSALGDALYCLFELGSFRLAHKLMEEAFSQSSLAKTEDALDLQEILELLKPLYLCKFNSLESAIHAFFAKKREDIGIKEFRTLSFLIEYALNNGEEERVHHIAGQLGDTPLAIEDKIYLDACRIWAFLLQKKWQEAAAIFDHYPLELLNQEGTLLHPLLGCYLYATEGEEIALIHLAGVTETPFPRSWALLGHELINKITDSPAWYGSSFLWERRRLYQQLSLFHTCAGNAELGAYYRYLESKEYIDAE